MPAYSRYEKYKLTGDLNEGTHFSGFIITGRSWRYCRHADYYCQGTQKSKKKGKGKTKRSKSGWINYNQIMLSTEFQGEAHILFEAIENLKSKISRLEKIKDEIEGLKRLGLEENLTYITYLNEGIPEKIVLHKRKDDEQEKFKFITRISLAVQDQ